MDETPEEMEQIRRDAANIDPNRYRKRRRGMAAVALGIAGAGVVWVVLEALDQRRNPCERVRDHFCRQDAASPSCQSYGAITRESVEEGNAQMRSDLRAQCVRKIERLKSEDSVTVP